MCQISKRTKSQTDSQRQENTDKERGYRITQLLCIEEYKISKADDPQNTELNIVRYFGLIVAV